jgi:nitroreductase
MANLGLSVDELLKTTRAVRKRLDFDRPVPDQVLRECVEYAIQAPTGSNVQGWHFVLVTERDKIEKIAAIYKKAFDWYRDSPVYAGRVVEGISEQRDAQQSRVADSADYLAENMHRSPALFIPCMEGRNATAGAAGSIVPAAWSFMLAAREQGLGTCWTTLHLMHEEETADVLGIPFNEVQQWALSPVAYTAGTDFKPATRPDVETVISWNSWTG